MRCVPAQITRVRLRDERGIAVPTVLIVIFIGLGLASVASIAAIGSIRNAGRDTSDKSALGIAEAGALQAQYRQNKILTTPENSAARCLSLSASNTLIATYANADGWCEEQTGSVNGGTYRYRVRPDLVNAITGKREIRIVSEGTLNGETRRVEIDAAASTGTPVFGANHVIGLNEISLNSNASITGEMATNGNVTLASNSNICGNVTVGPNKAVIDNSGGGLCPGKTVTQATTTLGPVDIGNVRTVNSNGRFFTQDTRTNPVTWNSTTRTLTLDSDGSLTMGGTNYHLCRLVINSNSRLIIAQGARVRIYFDSPEYCGLASGSTQLQVDSNARISVTSENPNDLSLLFVGSDTRETVISFNSNAQTEQALTIYAPKSTVNLNSNSIIRGAVAGKSVSLDSNAKIIGSASGLSLSAAVEVAYARTRYIECVGPLPVVGDPGAGC